MGAGWNGSMRGLLSFFGLALFTEGGEVGGFETAFTKKIKRESTLNEVSDPTIVRIIPDFTHSHDARGALHVAAGNHSSCPWWG